MQRSARHPLQRRLAQRRLADHIARLAQDVVGQVLHLLGFRLDDAVALPPAAAAARAGRSGPACADRAPKSQAGGRSWSGLSGLPHPRQPSHRGARVNAAARPAPRRAVQAPRPVGRGSPRHAPATQPAKPVNWPPDTAAARSVRNTPIPAPSRSITPRRSRIIANTHVVAGLDADDGPPLVLRPEAEVAVDPLVGPLLRQVAGLRCDQRQRPFLELEIVACRRAPAPPCRARPRDPAARHGW